MKWSFFGAASVLLFSLQVSGQNEPTAIRNLEDIVVRYTEFQNRFIAILPPSMGDMFLQPSGTDIPFEANGFKKHFLKDLIGTQHPLSGVPVYTVFIMEDAFSHIEFEVYYKNGKWRAELTVADLDLYFVDSAFLTALKLDCLGPEYVDRKDVYDDVCEHNAFAAGRAGFQALADTIEANREQ